MSHTEHNNGAMHIFMKKVFPRGCYIGFTGTPLMKKDKNSFNKFNSEIHRYTIDQAVRDKTVLPLLYESRDIEQYIINQERLDERFDLISRNLTDSQKEDLKRKWAKYKNISATDEKIAGLVIDISTHFTQNVRGSDFVAMLATSNKEEAIRCYKYFQDYTDIKCAFVISDEDSRVGHEYVSQESCKSIVREAIAKVKDDYGSLNAYEDKMIEEFQSGNIEILIVVEKLLTGFDVPRAQYLYLNKKLRDHSLLQAIARVNRLYAGKDYGYIIDYNCLLGDLTKALSNYSSLNGFSEEDIAYAVIDIKEIFVELDSRYNKLVGMFHSVKYKNDPESYEVLLADDKKRKEFARNCLAFGKALKFALSTEESYKDEYEDKISLYKRDFKFFDKIRMSVSIRYADKIDYAEYEPQMRELLNKYIGAEDVEANDKVIDIFDNSIFDDIVAGDREDRYKADAILSGVSKSIQEIKELDPNFFELISVKIEKIIKSYKK